jgi:hypothetical protein
MRSTYCAQGEAEEVAITDKGRLWGGQTGMRKPQAIALLYAFFMPRGQITNRAFMSFRAYHASLIEKEANMLDLIYLGLGAFLFVLMGLYARACGRL